jgi:hypothetical protein
MTTNTSAADAWRLVQALNDDNPATWGTIWREVVNDSDERRDTCASYLTRLAIGRIKHFVGDADMSDFAAAFKAALDDDYA